MSVSIIRLAATAAGEPAQPAADRVIQGDPRQRIANLYSDASGVFHAGVWHSSPGSWRVRYTEHEFCYVLRGRLRLAATDGVAEEFGAGDAFVVPAGFTGVWEVLESTTKLYAIYEPAVSEA